MPDVKTLFWLFGLALLTPVCAQAQVQVNPAALQQLQGLPLAPPAAQRVVAPPPVRHLAPHHKHPAKKKAEPKAGHGPALPTKPKAAAPPHPVLSPTAKPPAPAQTSALPPVVQINFAPNSAALPAGALAMLKPFCASSARIPLLARAPATPDAPSEAMQLSMQRAFALRAALMSCGVPAQNIIPQSTVGALGPNSDEALIGAMTKP